MNNNTRGFVALLFLEVLVPTSPPPAAAAHQPIYQHTHPPPISTNTYLAPPISTNTDLAPPQTMPLYLYGAEELNRGVAQRTKRWSGGALVFRCMFLEQTPVCCNSFQFADNSGILEITIRHPDFDNTEILLS